ncbi:MAG: long-chain fatty acid--CoA ligase [Aestuariivirga sp.]
MAKVMVKKQAEIQIPLKPIYSLLDEAVASRGQSPAMDFLGRQWSYGELGELVDKAAAGFRAIGVKRDVRVGLHLPNTPYYIICYFAILKAGGTVVNYNPLYVERELAQQIKDSDTSIMVTMDLDALYSNLAPLLGKGSLQKLVVCKMTEILSPTKSLLFKLFKRKDLARVVHGDRIVGFEKLITMGTVQPPDKIDPKSEIAVLQYTGGTTGVPKGAVLTHGNITANVEQLRMLVNSTEHREDRMMCALPFFHVFGMTVAMLLGMAFKAELILLPRFEVDQVLKTVVRKRPTMFPGVPTIYIALNRALKANGGKPKLDSIRYCISGGAPLPLEVQQEFMALTGCKLVEGYGLSEASPVVTCNPFDGENREGSIGLPLAGTVVEFRSLDDPRKQVKLGERGEVCVIGPQVMAVYWRQPEATKDVMIDGALRTGDVGYADPDGYIHIVDRVKDLIICSGYNVYPRVIEDALYSHPAVAEAVVIGVPDAYRGQSPKAFVKIKDGETLTAETLKTYLKTQLSKIEIPHEIEFRAELPRTLIGKFSKKVLLEEELAKAGRHA